MIFHTAWISYSTISSYLTTVVQASTWPDYVGISRIRELSYRVANWSLAATPSQNIRIYCLILDGGMASDCFFDGDHTTVGNYDQRPALASSKHKKSSYVL